MSSDQPDTPAAWASYYVQWGWLIFPVWNMGADGECACPGDPILDDGHEQRDKDGKLRKKNCRPGKHPIPKKGFLAASNDPDQITTWWTSYPDANIGLATGLDTGLVVIDADGPNGITSVEALNLPATVIAQSGSGHGRHYFFQHPGDANLPSWARGHDALPGVDFRGNGGYIILAPSNHVSGGNYTWIDGPKTTKFAPLPESFVETYCNGKQLKDDAKQADDDPEYIEEGRNVYLTRKAGTLRRAGMDDDHILTDLRWLNTEKCRPPLPDEELVRIAANIGKKPTGDTGPVKDVSTALGDSLSRHANTLPPILIAAPLNDIGNALCCDALHPNEFRFCKDKGKHGVWFYWTGTHWAEDKESRSERAMIATIHKRIEAAFSLLSKKSDRARLLRHCESSLNIGKIHSGLGAFSTHANTQVSLSDFDGNDDLMGTPGGTLDLVTGQIRPGQQEDMISRILSVSHDPAAIAPMWETFIYEIMGGDPEMIAYLQRIIGYTMTGSTVEQVFFVFHGLGANGKSTFLSLLGDLFGQYAASAAFSSFDADDRSTNSNDLARLRGVRMVACIESEHNRKLAEGRIKSVTGGDVISCRFLFAEHFEYTPQFKMILAVNHRPGIRGADQGIWRRVQLIPFNQSFSGDKADKHLKDKLAAEAPGILNWALHGLGEWRRIGLAAPDVVKDAVEDYRQESDQVTRWMDEYANIDPTKTIGAAEAYSSYRGWSIEGGERALSANYFHQRLKEKGFEKTSRKNGNSRFKGFTVAMTEISSASFGDGQFHIEDVG